MSKQAKPPPPGDKPTGSAPPPPPSWRNWLWPITILAIFILFFVLPTRSTSTSLTYSQFLSDVSSHQVQSLQISGSVGGTSTGTLKNGTHFTVVIPPQAGQESLTNLTTNIPSVSTAPSGQGFGTEVLIYLIVFGLPILLSIWLFRRISRGAGGQLGGVLGAGRSRAKVFDEERPSTTFADVAGYEGAKAEIAEVVDFLRNPDRYARGRGAGPARRAHGGPARHRQDPAGPGGRGRGPGGVLLGHRVQLRGAVRRRRRGARPRPVRAGPQAGARHHLHRRDRRHRPAPRRARAPWSPTTSASRPSTSCWPRWTGSSPQRASWCWAPPTGPRSWTRPCCGRAASTVRSRSRCRTSTNAPPSSPSTSRTRSWPRTST